MKNSIYLFLCLAVVACQSKPKANTTTDSTKINTMTTSDTGPFDLAKLKLTENLPDLMAGQGISKEAKGADDETMLGYEVFRTSDPKIIRFENTDLSGATGKNKNHVLFHYSEAQKTLAGYQLQLYNQAQTDKLISLLDKVASIVFKQTHAAKGSVEIDENGNEVKSENAARKTFRVWESKNNGLTYFLSENGSAQNLTAELIVLNRSSQFGKDWISSKALDWYKNEKSE